MFKLQRLFFHPFLSISSSLCLAATRIQMAKKDLLKKTAVGKTSYFILLGYFHVEALWSGTSDSHVKACSGKTKERK